MPVTTRQTLKKQIASGDTGPLYVLIGDDDSEKSAVATEFAEMVDEGLRAFSVDRLFGAEVKADDLFDAAATLPMMAPRRIVILFDAERLLIPRREGKAADAEQERLEAFVKNPPRHATVVFVCGSLDQRRRLVKLLLKEAQVVDCGTIVRLGRCGALGQGARRARQGAAGAGGGAHARRTRRHQYRPACAAGWSG
jgi:DNA polymerase-3 subunit delta